MALKITRFLCGNGDGMFEDSKGDYITFKDHEKAIKELKVSGGLITDEIESQIALALTLGRDPKIIMISGPAVKMFEDELRKLTNFLPPENVTYQPTHYRGIKLSFDENERYTLPNGAVPPAVMVGTNS